MTIDEAAVRATCAQVWADDVVPALQDYIRIPNVSPAYDAGWAEAGHMDRATHLIRDWLRARPVQGLTVEVLQLPGRTPVIVAEVAAFDGTAAVGTGLPTEDTVLLYGHLDKQPPMHGWREGLGPWDPVIEGGRLYGRGGGDDGYAAFAAMTAIEAVQAAGGRHARCMVVIEASEESGSPDLPAYVEVLAPRLGPISLVICLDSFTGDYERLWTTTSLRGLLTVRLRVDVLTEGVHSGTASGVVPSSFRVLRQLLDRIEDPATGRILLDALHAEVPPGRRAEIAQVAAEVPSAAAEAFPWAGGTQPMVADLAAQVEARTWHPTVSYTGIDGVPSGELAGNVLRPFTDLTLSFRLPPTVSAQLAADAITEVLEADPPSGAQVTVTAPEQGDGWDAPATAPWLAAAADGASRSLWGNPMASLGEGGSIPFMGMLGHRFPAAQFLVTGVLGPGSNAHGPNEYLELTMAERVTGACALVLDAHARRA